MAIKSDTLRPGLLVSLKTSVRGNVRYQKRDLQTGEIVEGGAEVAKWETERTVQAPEEYEDAKKVRNKARALISGVCSHTSFGMLCPDNAVEQLEAAIKTARDMARDFNDNAAVTQVGVYVITGRVSSDDMEAVRAIHSEVRELLGDMSAGISNGDVKAIRDAADRAKSIGEMLAPASQAQVMIAIEAARAAARKIKAAEGGTIEVDRRAISKITDARTQFLDLEEREAVDVSVPTRGRAIELAPEA